MNMPLVQRMMCLPRSRMPATSSPICGYIIGSPPQIETTGAPHSSTAARHSSSGMRSVMVDSYSRMRPQPVHVRLQACSGSSIITIGKRLLIIGCGAYFSPVFAGRMRKGLAASAAATAVFCHSGRGLRRFLMMYPARPAVMESGNLIVSAVLARVRPYVGSQRQQREVVLVHVVIQIENLRESRTGRQLFGPASIGALRFQKIFDAVLYASAANISTGY